MLAPEIKNLSNHGLLLSLKDLLERERRISRTILLHLKEIQDRKLYADRGYPNLFKMLVVEFKLCESSANRRITAMQLLRDVPQAEESFVKGEVNLSTLSKAQSQIKREEKITGIKIEQTKKEEIVEQIKNKTQAETEVELMRLLPESASCPKTIERRISETESRLSINMPDRLKEKLTRLQELWAHSNSSMDYVEIIEKAVDHTLARIDPMLKKVSPKKLKQAEESAPQAEKRCATAAVAQVAKNHAEKKIHKRPAYYGVGIFKVLWTRANGCCEYVDQLTGRRCTSRFGVEKDHIIPIAKGGTNHISNLRLACRSHNQLFARRHFGAQKIEKEIQKRRGMLNNRKPLKERDKSPKYMSNTFLPTQK